MNDNQKHGARSCNSLEGKLFAFPRVIGRNCAFADESAILTNHRSASEGFAFQTVKGNAHADRKGAAALL